MLSPKTTRGLLGIFPRGADLTATDLHATTLPIQLPTSLSLWAISAAKVGGRSARGRASGRKGPQKEGGRRVGEGGRNRDAWEWPRGKAETGRRTTTRGRTTAEEERRQRDHGTQGSSDGDRGELRGDGQGEIEADSEGWNGGSEGDSAEETEEDGMTKGEPGRSGDTLTASPWGTQ